MEIPSIARQSVSAEISVFAQVELEAFAEQSHRTSPLGWALVERDGEGTIEHHREAIRRCLPQSSGRGLWRF